MILMVLNHPEEFVLDNLREVKIIDGMYFVNRKAEVFKSEEPFGAVSKHYGVSRLFMPAHDCVSAYEKVEAKNCVEKDCVEKEQEVIKAKAVWCLRNGEEEVIVIHPLCEAYLCNDNGKTIKKLN